MTDLGLSPNRVHYSIYLLIMSSIHVSHSNRHVGNISHVSDTPIPGQRELMYVLLGKPRIS